MTGQERLGMRIGAYVSVVCLLFGLIFEAADASGQPDWFVDPERDFPRDQYLTGVGVGTGDDEAERVQLAEENARSSLIRSIRIRVSSEFIDITTESSQRVDEYTQSRVNSSASLEVDGIQIERREVEKETIYALAVLPKAEGRLRHIEKLRRLDEEIERGIVEAHRYEKAGDLEAGLKAYLRLYPLLSSREETQVVLLALGDFAFSTFQELGRLEGVDKGGRADVDAAVQRLTGGSFRTVDDGVAMLAFLLGQQLDPGHRVLVLPFTYGETRFHSPFSRYLARTLAHKLVEAEVQSVQVNREFRPRGSDHQREQAQQAGADVVITGSYLEKGDRVKVFALASEVQDGRKVAAADLQLLLSVIQDEKLDILPQNYQQALQDAGVFGKDELIPAALQVEVWTDQGAENVLLEEDEELVLGVRANQPCYLQIVYHLANGMRTLLHNNYYVNAAMVNHAVMLPDTFYVDEPFGVEVLQAMASTEGFPEVRTRDWEGYPVLEEDLEQYVSRTRGLRKKEKVKRMAEARMTVTTIRKR